MLVDTPEEKHLTNKNWRLVGNKASGTNIIHVVLKAKKPDEAMSKLAGQIRLSTSSQYSKVVSGLR